MFYKKDKRRTQGSSLIILLIMLLTSSGSVLAQTDGDHSTPEEITPENIQDLELLYWFGEGAYTGGIAQYEGDTYLAAATTTGIAILDRENGSQIGFIPIGLQPYAIAISPDGSTLAAVVNYPTGDLGGFAGLQTFNRQIQFYSLPDGERKEQTIQDLGECANSNIWDIAYTPDGKELVFEKKYSANEDADIQKFCAASLTEGKVTRSLDVSPISTMAMVISPDGKYIAAIEEKSNTVSIYDTADFSLIQEFTIPETEWPVLDFSSSGRALAVRTTSTDDPEAYSIRIWNLSSGEMLYSGTPDLTFSQDWGQYDMMTSFEVSRDGKTIYLGTQFGYVVVMDAGSGNLENQLGPFLWTSHNLTANPKGATSYETPAAVKNILLSADEKWLTAIEDLSTVGQSGSIHIFQMPEGREVVNFHGSMTGNENSGIAFSADSSRIALAGANDGKVEIHDTQTGQVVRELHGHTEIVNQIAFSPDGKMIATASDDMTIRLWEAESGTQLHTLTGHEGRVNRIAFSPDSSWLISGADDNTLRRWNTEDGSLLETLELGNENWRVDFLDILQDNQSVLYRISKYPSLYLGYLQKQVMWNTQTGERTDIGGSNTNITKFAGGKEMFAGYSDTGRIAGKLNADGSVMVIATFRSPYGNGNLTLATIAPNQRLIISGNGFGMHSWELTGEDVNFIGLTAADQPVPAYGYEYIFSPDGRYLAYTSGGVAYVMGVQSQ